MYDELVRRLNEYSAEHQKHGGITAEAADAIEELQDALLLMVLQYCTTDDELLYHSFMSAGENAFAALGLENGQQTDLLWDRVLIQKPPKEE